MAYTHTPTYRTRGIKTTINGNTLSGLMSVSGLGGGNNNEIDITTLRSAATENEIGLTDGGTITLEGIASPQEQIFQDIQDANKTGNAMAVQVLIGGLATSGTDKDYATNNGVVRKTWNGSDTGVTGSATSLVITDKNDVPAVLIGDYIQAGDNKYGKISAIAENTGNITITYGSITGGTYTGDIKLVRPAIRFDFNVRVNSIELPIGVNDVLKYNIGLRVTGEVTMVVGTPNIS